MIQTQLAALKAQGGQAGGLDGAALVRLGDTLRALAKVGWFGPPLGVRASHVCHESADTLCAPPPRRLLRPR